MGRSWRFALVAALLVACAAAQPSPSASPAPSTPATTEKFPGNDTTAEDLANANSPAPSANPTAAACKQNGDCRPKHGAECSCVDDRCYGVGCACDDQQGPACKGELVCNAAAKKGAQRLCLAPGAPKHQADTPPATGQAATKRARPTWAIALGIIAVLVVVTLCVGILVLRRRRSRQAAPLAPGGGAGGDWS